MINIWFITNDKHFYHCKSVHRELYGTFSQKFKNLQIFDFFQKSHMSSTLTRKELEDENLVWHLKAIQSLQQFRTPLNRSCNLVMIFLKLFYINFDRCFFIILPQVSNINLNIPSSFLSLIFYLILLFHFILRSYI